MKRLTLIALLFVVGTMAAMAQKNTIVGKWKLSSYTGEGMTVNVDNPAESKKQLAEQMKKGTGTEPDSAQVEMIYNSIAPMFAAMTFEFTDKGKAFVTVPDATGSSKTDTASYVVDYTTGTFTVTTKDAGKDKVDSNKFRFDGELLAVETDKGEVIKFKRAK